MSEKAAKEMRRMILTEYVITAYKDGRVDISGDLDNILLYRDVMNRAERAVLNRLANKLKKGNNGGIIVPTLDTRGLKLAGGV